MIILLIEGPKIFAWKSHAGYGKKSFNPLYKEREFVQHQIRKQYDGNLINCAISITIQVCIPTPTSISKKKREEMIRGDIKPVKRPDCTNIQKFYEDCIKGIVIEDDSIVCDITTRKRYGSTPHVTIIIEEI